MIWIWIWIEYEMNMILWQSLIELNIFYSILFCLEQVLDLSQGWSQLVKVFHQFSLKLQPQHGTRCMSVSPAPGQRIQSFLAKHSKTGGRFGQIRLFGRLCHFSKTLPSHSKLCLSQTAPDEVAPDRFCFPKANMVLPARASEVLSIISRRAKVSGGFHGSKTSTFSQEAFGDRPCKAPSDLGWKT